MSSKQKGMRILRTLALLLTVFVLVFIVFYGSLAESYDYDIGSVAESDIYAPRTFVDSYETEHQAVIARNSVSAIFIRSDEISEENSDNVEGFFDLVSQERSIYSASLTTTSPITSEQAASELSVNIKQTLDAEISAESLLVFMDMSDSSFSYIKDKAISMTELIMVDDIDESMLESSIDSQIDSFKQSNPSYSEYADSLKIVLDALLQPNSVFDETATNDSAENSYLNAIQNPVTIDKGALIVSSGDVITEHIYQNLVDLELIRVNSMNLVILLRDFVYVAAIVVCLLTFLSVKHKNDSYNPRTFYTILITFVISVFASVYLSELSSLFCVVLFFTVICSSYIGTFDGIVLSIGNLLLMWPIYSFDIELLFINIIAIIVCASLAGRTDKVSSSATLILLPTVMTVFASLSYGFINNYTRDEYINSMIFSLVSSTASLVAAVGIMPVYELFSNVASPVKLIILSQPGQHLLKRLFLEASGTYSHSMMVANLADSGAEAIGADSLLCKVAAYYHDIGKLDNPQYFTENQHDGINPHDKLPIMESLAIITRHPENGVKLARKERLPLAIIKIIDEHHGTTYPAYFYYKACEEAKAKGLEHPDVENFKYHGHIPSSRESAVVMLADTCEAAVRSTKQTDTDGAEALIRKLVKDKIDQDQLINSGLSFDDVEKIILAFKQIYAGVFHERIEYPNDNKNS